MSPGWPTDLEWNILKRPLVSRWPVYAVLYVSREDGLGGLACSASAG